MLFSGIYANLNSIASWIAWLKWTSPIKYGLEGFLQNEFRVLNANDYDILDTLGFSFGLWNSIIVLILIAIVFRLLAYFALKNLITKF